MRVRFWGTRGSLPVSLTAGQVRDKIAEALLAARGRSFTSLDDARAFAGTLPFAVGGTFGGQSPCLEIELSPPGREAHEYVVCDAGSGLRAFGQDVLARHGPQVANTFHIFMSHLHWDHIMGFPFFTPAYLPGTQVHLYGCHPGLKDAFVRQQEPPSFPVPLSYLRGTLHFHVLEPAKVHEIAGMRVSAMKQLHGGDSYGWRFEHGGRTLVYSTDSEHKLEHRQETDDFIAFFRDADTVVFDSMYSLADAVSVKADWGHSSNVVGVELCQLAGVRRLVLFHHEPIFGDQRIADLESESRRLEGITREGRPQLDVIAAYDGLEIVV